MEAIMRKHEFHWDLVSNILDSRQNLGKYVDLEMYRLMQFTLRDILEERFGSEIVDEAFYAAGMKAGRAFYAHKIHPVSSPEEFARKTQEALNDEGIGVLRFVEALFGEEKIVLTVDEDVDCSGLSELDYELCIYDEGFISALVNSYTQHEWAAQETDSIFHSE